MAAEPVKAERPLIQCNLLTRHALEVMVEKMPELSFHMDQIKAGASRHCYFPDGTLLIEGEHTLDRLWDFMTRNGLWGAGDEDGVWQPAGFGSLAPFPKKACSLWYTAAYRESLGELEFGIVFPGIWSRPTSDYQLENLQISVSFTKRPSLEVRRRFAAFLGDWFQTVSQQGMFGEGPIRPVSAEVEFRKRYAQFRVDASRSGQDTLNWLLISVLNFGYTVSLVQDFFFNHKVELFELEKLGDEAEKVPIP